MYRIILEKNEGNHRVTLPDGREAVLNWCTSGEELTHKITLPYDGVYGLGEKFGGINQKGKNPVNRVEEKFCYQGEKTYCPAPFFFTDTGFGMYIDKYREIQFEFQETICFRRSGGDSSEDV